MTAKGAPHAGAPFLRKMDYHLPTHLSFGLLGARAVLLDLNADRYSLLGESEAGALCALGLPETAPPAQVLCQLIRGGIVREGSGSPVRPVVAPPLCSSALESRDNDGDLPVWQAAAVRLQAALVLRVRGLGGAIWHYRELRERRSGEDARPCSHDAARIARGYAKARVLVPARRLCVPDSLALVSVLWRRGIAAELYFGVRLNPFAAHAWVQQNGMLLSDPLNVVADYTPVFRL